MRRLALCAALAACGDGDSGGQEVPGGADSEAVEVIDDWSTALRDGDVEAAAEFFDVPSLAQNGTPPLELSSRQEVIEFNEALPCGAELVRAEAHGRFVLATFELTERPGGLYDTDTGLVRFGRRDYDPRWPLDGQGSDSLGRRADESVRVCRQ